MCKLISLCVEIIIFLLQFNICIEVVNNFMNVYFIIFMFVKIKNGNGNMWKLWHIGESLLNIRI